MRPPTSPSGQVLVIFAGGLVTILMIIGARDRPGVHVHDPADGAECSRSRGDRRGKVTSGPDPAQRRAREDASCGLLLRRAERVLSRARGASHGCVIPANDPNGTVLTVKYPPSNAAPAAFVGTPAYVEVGFSRVHRSFLAGIIGSSQHARVVECGDRGIHRRAVELELTDRSRSWELLSGRARPTATGDITDPSSGAWNDGGYVHVNSTCSQRVAEHDVRQHRPTAGSIIDGNGTVTSPQST